jgi:hypothetical protein
MTDPNLIPVRTDEVDVDRKAHAEGVDAGATRDEQAGTNLVDPQLGEAEQARPPADGHWNLTPEDAHRWQLTQTVSQAGWGHATPRLGADDLSPPRAPLTTSVPSPRTGVQTLFQARGRESMGLR